MPSRIAAGNGIELADIPDIDRPDRRSVRVARRADPLLAVLLIRNRDRDDGQYYLAAERLRRDIDLAQGLVGEQERLGGVSGGGNSGGLPLTILNAQTRVRLAMEAARGSENNADIADVIRLVVGGWVPLGVVTKRRRYGKPALNLLRDGLERLAVHYGMIPKVSR